MRKWLRKSLFVLNLVLYIITVICCILGAVADIIQPINLVRLFEYLHINLSYTDFIIVGWACAFLAIALHFLRNLYVFQGGSMKKKNVCTTDRYVLADDELIAIRCFTPFTLVGFSVYTIILLIWAFREKNDIVCWLFAGGFLLVLFILCYNTFRYLKYYFMQFCICDYKISNSVRSHPEVSLKLFDQLFFTTAAVEFSFGRVERTKTFYLFSERKVQIDDIDGSGFNVLIKLYHNGIVIIPKTEATDLWINSELKISTIPNFPDSVILNQPPEQLPISFIDG